MPVLARLTSKQRGDLHPPRLFDDLIRHFAGARRFAGEMIHLQTVNVRTRQPRAIIILQTLAPDDLRIAQCQAVYEIAVDAGDGIGIDAVETSIRQKAIGPVS